MRQQHTVIIGAGMAGLAAAITLSGRGERVTLIERQAAPGGKMRQVSVANTPIDAGPTVFTMKWVFDRLFDENGGNFDRALKLEKANVLARHAWDDTGHFDLYADREQSADEIGDFFSSSDAAGYLRFCADSKSIHDTLQHTFMAAQRPGPLELSRRIGLLKPHKLLALKPMSSLWSALGNYFKDPRLRQLYGRYATYVGSSPYQAPATLMLIAHVEQEGVWTVEGGMHALAKAMHKQAVANGVDALSDSDVQRILIERGEVDGVELINGDQIKADRVIYCGDASRLSPQFFNQDAPAFSRVDAKHRSLSAITWTVSAKTSGLPLHRHNVFFSNDYRAEFDSIFKESAVPSSPTVYVCAQNRDDRSTLMSGSEDHMLCLINAPAFGDTRRLSKEELDQCEENTFARLSRCGLAVERNPQAMQVTQPADFEALFPASGGALYGRASHGWMASFARPGARTKLSGFYLAGGSVHPGAGVPMATLSGQLAAQQMIADRTSA